MSIYQKSDFNYELPDDLIARYPLQERSASRLLIADIQAADKLQLHDRQVRDLPEWVAAEDLLVFNNTRVLPARLFGEKTSGGKIELLIERVQDAHHVAAYIRASKAPKEGAILRLGQYEARVDGRHEALFYLSSTTAWAEIMQNLGEMPIPPYLNRQADKSDDERYQTVYAKQVGAVAAPTAGLHFDSALLAALQAKGIASTEITLHVGAGTFQPVRHEDLSAHVMHKEWFSVSAENIAAIEACRARGGRVIAIGTTSLRALESAAQKVLEKEGASGGIEAVSGEKAIALQPFTGDTDLFITPPDYRFRVVDALFTNFHLPESTLLMLVSAFAGMDNTRRIYAHAIAEKYRFYSYGDAMFIPRRLQKITE